MRYVLALALAFAMCDLTYSQIKPGGPTGTWQVEGVGKPSPLFPWEVVLRADGSRLFGAVSSCNSVRGAFEIFSGQVNGTTVTFKCRSGDLQRIVSLTGNVNGDEIDFTWELQDTRGTGGADPMFGAAAPKRFVAKRVPDATDIVAERAALPSYYPLTFDRILHTDPCSRLQAASIPDVMVTASELISGGRYTLPYPDAPNVGTAVIDLPQFCRVTAMATPTPESAIVIELWIPVSDWNGKLLGTGNLNFCGGVNSSELALGLREHYATAGTNRGHEGCLPEPTLASPARMDDFGFRAVHLMTTTAKTLTATYYGRQPAHAYFVGGSTGGGEALMEAQRYPDDYDGIEAGAPVNNWVRAMAANLWSAQVATTLTPPKLRLLNHAVIAACDSFNQIGALDDPRLCLYDPDALRCLTNDDADSCLTPSQVDAAKQLYAGPRDPQTGSLIYPGFERGSELGWPVGGPVPLFETYFRLLVHEDATWNWRRFDLARDLSLADHKHHSVLDATDSNLQPFARRGGKLILSQGWDDVGPRNIINYYESVKAVLGSDADRVIRLFMMPRVAHGSGRGPDKVNALAPLERWVESGVAPDRILAQHIAGPYVTMERPLCPYPEVARWKGSGSVNDAANFECALR
jgi:feruloyl esterase